MGYEPNYVKDTCYDDEIHTWGQYEDGACE